MSRWLLDLRIPYKIGLVSALGILAALLVAIIAGRSYHGLSAEVSGMDRTVTGLARLSEFESAALQMRSLQVTGANRAESDSEWRELRSEASEALSALEADSGPNSLEVASIRRSWDDYLHRWDQVMQGTSAKSGDDRLLSQVFHSELVSSVVKLREAEFSRFGELRQASGQAMGAATRTLWFVVLGFAALAALFAAFVTRQLVKSVGTISDRLTSMQRYCLTDLGRAMEAFAEGDLTAKAEPRTTPTGITSKDEIGTAAQTFDAALLLVQGIVSSYV